MSVEREREKVFLCFHRENKQRRKKEEKLCFAFRSFSLVKERMVRSIRILDLRERMAQWRKVTHCRPLLSLCAAAAVV